MLFVRIRDATSPTRGVTMSADNQPIAKRKPNRLPPTLLSAALHRAFVYLSAGPLSAFFAVRARGAVHWRWRWIEVLGINRPPDAFDDPLGSLRLCRDDGASLS
jgi:hypothetical protein